eukprot:TRINITY_DN33380_c0_g2_i1.p1 TRINITY_DN33380_c0_g2~~TRINITY_DN33380_c0_g2_i1.p1  ORF type:complete len:654 (-),score=122.55 TRINITY_DN33380_c0_g2_i1:195-2156(-)
MGNASAPCQHSSQNCQARSCCLSEAGKLKDNFDSSQAELPEDVAPDLGDGGPEFVQTIFAHDTNGANGSKAPAAPSWRKELNSLQHRTADLTVVTDIPVHSDEDEEHSEGREPDSPDSLDAGSPYPGEAPSWQPTDTFMADGFTNSKAMVAQVTEFVRQASGESAGMVSSSSNPSKIVVRSPSRRKMHWLKVTETMGINCSSALQLIINNPGELESYYTVDNETKLGQGTFGIVRTGTVKATKAARAVKSISKELMKERVSVLKHEIQVNLRADHPHLVMLYEIFEDRDHLHLVMTLCHGGHMQAYVEDNGRLRLGPAAAAMKQLLRAVFYLHRNWICHRDLKSENLLLLHPGPFTGLGSNLLKLADFGLSCFFKKGEILVSNVGTPSHMAPEVVAKRYNKCADMWSCGVIFFFLMSGTLPFDVKEEGVKRFQYSLGSAAWEQAGEDAASFIASLLERSVRKRVTAKDGLKHPFILNNVPIPPAAEIKPGMLARLKKYRSMDRFKRAVLNVVASLLSEAAAAPSHRVFEFLDVSGDGLIAIDELSKIVGKKEAEQVFTEAYERGGTRNQYFTYMEFLAATFDWKRYLTKAVLQTAFSCFDHDGDGSISMSELASGRLLGHLTARELQSTLEHLDKNGDQEIDFDEFTRFMQDL